MKASRILAGMSAVALAGSMLSMVSFADEAPAEKTYPETGFGVQGYVQDSTQWSWQAKQVDGAVNVTYNYTELVAKYGDTDYTKFGIAGAGVQFYAADAGLEKDDVLTADIEYKITAKDFEESKTLNFEKKWDPAARNWSVPDETAEGAYGAFVDNGTLNLFGSKTWDELIALGDVTVEAKVSNIKVAKAEEAPAVEYKFPWTEENDKVADEWADDCYVSNEVYALAPKDKNVKVTIDYTLDGKHDYYLAALCTANGWGKVYDEHAQEKYDEAVADGDEELAENLKASVWKSNSIQGVTLKSSLSKEELDEKKSGDPILQDDGYFIFYESGSLTFEITPEAVNWLATNLTADGYGGSLFQVYGVDITKITLEEATEPVEPAEGYTAFEMWSDLAWNPAANWGVNNGTAEGGHGTDAQITKDGTYTVSFGPAYNDADGNVVYGTAPEGTEQIKWAGAGVWNVDIEGLADAIGASTAGIDDLTAADKKQIAVDAGLEISNVKVLVDGEEFYQIPDEKLLYGDIEGNGKIRIEIMNQYGNGTYDPTSEFYVEEFFNKAAELTGSEVAVTFDIAGIPTDPVDPTPTPVEPTEHKYALETEDGDTEAEVSLKVGDSYDFSVILTDDGEPVEGEDIIWAEVDDTSATAVTSVGDVEPTAVKTDEDGVSTITLYAQKVGSGTITATYTDEDGEEYVVTFKATITAADSSSDSGSSSSKGNNSGNGGSNSGAAAEDSNPATGAAALGTVGILLAGAAMAVSKKKQ